MLARLGADSVLQQLGRAALLLTVKCKSWFQQVRTITQQYSLPDPLEILHSPPSKESWKKICKANVISRWEERLRGEAALLFSLTYFKPMFMSLAFPHPMWTMAESPFEVRKACTSIVLYQILIPAYFYEIANYIYYNQYFHVH